MRRPLALAALAGAGALAAAGTVITLPSPRPPEPANNPSTPAKVELGRMLFYDPLLSRDESVSCASCHLQDHAFSDPRPLSLGVEGREGFRNSQTLMNVGFRDKLFWHGGSPSLELQAMHPITDHAEMDMTVQELERRLLNHAEYPELFQKAFGRAPDTLAAVQALAAFQRSLVSYASPFDHYQAGDLSALSDQQVRGMELFFDRAECFHCHTGRDFTDLLPHNNAFKIFNDDIGVAEITGRDEDVGKFITPTLRNVGLTAPYMHDGSMETLEEVVSMYNRGGEPNINADVLMRPLGLTESEEADLVAFLHALTDPTIAKNPAWSSPFKTSKEETASQEKGTP